MAEVRRIEPSGESGWAPRALAVVAITLCSLGTACEDPESEPASQGQIWTLEIQDRFGGEALPLTRVYLAAFGPDGLVALADGPPTRVLLLKSGQPPILIGGQGAGPSEYGYVNELGFAGDTLWLTDARSAKAAFYDLEGRFVRSARVSLRSEGPRGRATGPVRPLRDAGWLVSEPTISITAVMSGWTDARAFLRVVGDSVRDTVFVEPLPQHDFMRVPIGEGALEGVHPVPQRPLFESGVDGAGFWVVDRRVASAPDSANFTIHRIGQHGDTLWSRDVGYKPVPLTKEWKAAWYSARASALSEAMKVSPGPLESAFRDAVLFPPFFPPVSHARAGRDGRLWLEASRADTLRVDWLVFDATGGREGLLQAPSGFRLLAADSSEVLGVLTDELDVETLVRAAIRRTGSGSER